MLVENSGRQGPTRAGAHGLSSGPQQSCTECLGCLKVNRTCHPVGRGHHPVNRWQTRRMVLQWGREEAPPGLCLDNAQHFVGRRSRGSACGRSQSTGWRGGAATRSRWSCGPPRAACGGLASARRPAGAAVISNLEARGPDGCFSKEPSRCKRCLVPAKSRLG